MRGFPGSTWRPRESHMPRPALTIAKTTPSPLNGCPWRINLFGGLAAWRGNVEITRVQTRKSGGLLAYLAYHLNQNHTRDEIIDNIWPELDVERARVCLSS